MNKNIKKCSKCNKKKSIIDFYGRGSQCKSCQLERNKKYREIHKEEKRKYMKDYYRTHKEERREYGKNYNKKYRRIHKKERNKYKRKWHLKQKELNSKYKMNRNISSLLRYSLKNRKNGHHWENLVGYTLKQLMDHLESKFDSKMTWNNHGSYWHIDHIIPINLWKYENANDREFKQCWALANLQPLKVYDNLSKGAKILKEDKK